MKFIGSVILHIFSNAVAILAADRFITGFSFKGDFVELLIASAILAVIHTLILPILKFVLTPFIIITIGLLVIVLNASALYVLDILIKPLTMEGYLPLLFGTLLISAVNILTGLAARMYHK